MAIVKTLIVKGVARFLTDAYMSTIRSGIWNGSTILVGYGGTGVTSAKGDLYTPVFLSSSGIAPCSVEIPHATKDFKINGVTYAVFTNSTGTAPTIFAPTALAGTGGYILATNAAKTGLEWVAKPATNVTTSAVVGSSATDTTLIADAQANPYYNLLEGGSVTRSIRFVAGNGITISAATDGQITITNSKPDVNHNTDHRKAFYGTCETAAATAAKVVTISDTTGWELRAGTVIGVKFTYSNTASSVTLAVNGEAAKSIFYDNAVYTGSSTDVCGKADRFTYYMYDGTNWAWLGSGYVINTTYSVGTAALLQAGTSTTNRVWQAKILQDEFVSKRGDTMTGDLSLNDGVYIKSSNLSDTAGYALLGYTSGNILGAFGDGTTATIPTYIRSTGNNLYHRKGNNSSHTDHLIADAGNIVNDNITIGWNTETTIATIAGIPIKIKIPTNPDTWRNVYTNGTSRIGTGTGTKAINFASTNLTINYLAVGTGSGLSGSANYFTIDIEAKNWTGATSSAAGTAGYMPGAASADRLKYLRGDGSWIALAPSISAGTTDTNKVKITVGGESSSEFTVPFATTAAYLKKCDWTASGDTVGDIKSALLSSRLTSHILSWTTVGYNFIQHFDDNNFNNASAGGNYSVISISGYQSQMWNQFLVSCHSTFNLGVIGLSLGNWVGVKWLVYRDELPTKESWNYDDVYSKLGHKHSYTDLTGSTTTANLAIVSNGTADGWTLKTLGSRAFDSTSYLPLSGGTLSNSTTTHPINTLNSTNSSTDAWNKDGNALLRLEASNNLMIITLGNGNNERTGLIQVGHSALSYANAYGKLHLNKFGGNVYINNSLAAHAGNISDKSATIGTSLTTIATIAGVDIKAKIPAVTTQAIELVSVSKTLAVSTWTDMAAVSTYSGTYAIQISDGTLYASGTFSVCGGTDAIVDEIPLHVSSTGATWRPYARISAGQLQMTTNEATGTARTYTIKILKLI